MIADLQAVLWKEWREQIMMHGSVTRWALNVLMIVGVLGIFLPWQFGPTAIESISMLMWVWMPILLVMNSVADAIAGERERHTLETLLASRLPDRAILFGKLIVPVVQSSVIMLLAAALAVITVNLLHPADHFRMYPPAVLFGLVTIPPLAGLLVAGAGVFASARAATVRQAYQRMMIPILAVVVLPSLGLALLPRDLLAQFYSLEFAQGGLLQFLMILALILLALDALILALAARRFQRDRLLLDG